MCLFAGAEESSGMRADVLESWLVCLGHNISKSRGARTRTANLAVFSPDWPVACMLSLANTAQPIRRWTLAYYYGASMSLLLPGGGANGPSRRFWPKILI